MKIPNSLEIIGHTITIRKEDCLKVDDQDEAGIASFADDTILLAHKCHDLPLSRDSKNEAYWHEILHFIDAAFDTDLTDSQVQRLARGLHAVIRDNKIDLLDKGE